MVAQVFSVGDEVESTESRVVRLRFTVARIEITSDGRQTLFPPDGLRASNDEAVNLLVKAHGFAASWFRRVTGVEK